MIEILLFGEQGKLVTSSCSSCTGCQDGDSHLCTDKTPEITSEELATSLLEEVVKQGLNNEIMVEFRDINKEDLTNYKDVKTLINMSFAFPILTVNGKIKFMGPFNSSSMLNDIKEEFLQ